jgi:hypothetical protein
VATGDADGDARADVTVWGAGRVRVYAGKDFPRTGEPTPIRDDDVVVV